MYIQHKRVQATLHTRYISTVQCTCAIGQLYCHGTCEHTSTYIYSWCNAQLSSFSMTSSECSLSDGMDLWCGQNMYVVLLTKLTPLFSQNFL